MGCTTSSTAVPELAVLDSNGNTTGNKAISNGQRHNEEHGGGGGGGERGGGGGGGQENRLRGDVVKRYEARKDREQRLKEKQNKITSAAEELSSQVLEEKELLSLTSRGTSLATSRTGSPNGNRKHVVFKPPPAPDRLSESGEKPDSATASNAGVKVRVKL